MTMKSLFITSRHILIIFITLLSITSCYENIIEGSIDRPHVNEQYYDSNDNICILKEEMTQYIDDMVISDSLLIFNANIPEEALPKVGTNIFIPVSDKTPYGFLAKVSSIERGSKVYIQTTTLPLEEVFDYLSIDNTVEITNEFEGVYDDDGNPIEYEIIDTTNIDLSDTTIKSISTRAFEVMELGNCVKFPIKIYKSENSKISVDGAIYAGFKNFDLDIDISNHSFKYLNLTATPFLKVAVSGNVSTEKKVEATKRLAQLRYRLTIPTPLAGVPIIVPITVYVYGTVGASGEIGATFTLQYDYECYNNIRYKNGSWSSDIKHGGFDNKSPWTPIEFNVNGEIYAESKIGIIAGLYSATTGVGFNVIPKVSVGTSAELSSTDLLKINPEVYLSLKASSEIYCVAEIFGWEIGKYTMELPELTIWKGNTYLLPNINKFEAKANKSSADITWQHDSFYFLSPLGVKTGTTVFESDMSTEVNSYEPTPTHPNFYTSVYSVNASGLQYGKKYYAAPYASWGEFKWYGDMEEFCTEASYNLAFRCANWDYDVINFPFSINGESTNIIDYTTEANDYDGSAMSVHITAQYNEETMTLSGLFDFYFYEDPGQQRIDGFTVSLASGDSGYVTCNKVIDNGGCTGAIRVYNNMDNSVKNVYKSPQVNSNCNCTIGLFNKTH